MWFKKEKILRILIENEVFKHQGGSETIAIHTFETLKKRGHEVFFFATKTDNYYIKDYEYSKYFPENVYSFKNYIKNPLAYYWNFEAVKLFKKMLIEVKPDIVHFNLLISPSIVKACYDMSIINLFLYFLISIIIGLIQYIQINYFKVRTIRK